MPESPSHIALKQLLVTKLKAWYGASIDEYPSSGHELDVFATTTEGVSIYVEIIWSSSRTQFLSDINMLQQSNADVKLAVASPEIIANTEMVREFKKVVVSQRLQGKMIHGDLLDGQRMMEYSAFVDHDFRGLIDQLVSQARKAQESAGYSTASNEEQHISSLKKSANRLLPIKSFRLPAEVQRWVGRDTVALMVFWLHSEMFIDLWYDPHPRMPFARDLSGGALAIDQFLSILELNPEMRKYEFGVTGRPSSVLVVLFEAEEVLGYVGSYKLLESIRGVQGDQIRKIIRALT